MTQINPDVLRSLHAYQKNKSAGWLRLLRIIAGALCTVSLGLGLIWFFKASWLALIFAIIFGLAGLAAIGISFFIADKLNTFNNITMTAVNVYETVQNKDTFH